MILALQVISVVTWREIRSGDGQDFYFWTRWGGRHTRLLCTKRQRPAAAVAALKAGKTYRLRFVQILPAPSVQISLASDSGIASWKPLLKDAAPVPPSEAKLQPAKIEMWPGETYDFEFRPKAKEELRLESTIFGKFCMMMLVEVD
jgi:hypothetical protein